MSNFIFDTKFDKQDDYFEALFIFYKSLEKEKELLDSTLY